jgi:hypothetical protein
MSLAGCDLKVASFQMQVDHASSMTERVPGNTKRIRGPGSFARKKQKTKEPGTECSEARYKFEVHCLAIKFEKWLGS